MKPLLPQGFLILNKAFLSYFHRETYIFLKNAKIFLLTERKCAIICKNQLERQDILENFLKEIQPDMGAALCIHLFPLVLLSGEDRNEQLYGTAYPFG